MRHRTYFNAGYSHDAGGPTRYGHHKSEAVVVAPPVQHPIGSDAADTPPATETTATDATAFATPPGESRL